MTIVKSRELTVLVVLKIFQGLEKAFGTVIVKVVNKTLHLSARIRICTPHLCHEISIGSAQHIHGSRASMRVQEDLDRIRHLSFDAQVDFNKQQLN